MTDSTAPTSGAAAGPVLPRLRGLAPSLVPSQRRVAQAILADPGTAAQLTIGELAQAAETSQTTVMRLCQQLGLGGFRDLRVALAAENGRAAATSDGTDFGSDIQPTDSLDDVIRTITHADAAAVLETGQVIDRAALTKAVDAVASARRIDVFGVGASAFVASDLQQKLHRIGLISFCWPDQHAALTAIALAGPGDVTVGISHTGNTRDTVDIIERARGRGVTTVAITSGPRSHLAQAAQHALITASRETTFRSGAMASRIAALTVVDLLFVAVAQRGYERTLAAVDATRRAVAHRRFDTPARGAR